MPDNIPNSPYVVWETKGFQEELSLLLAVSTGKLYRRGEIVYLQGEMSRAFYFVSKGKVKVCILKEDGSEKILSIQEKNTFFGESAAFDRHPYFATAQALQDSEIRIIPVERAESLIEKHPRVAFLVIRRIIRKLRLLGFQVEDMAFLDAQKRIAHMLITLCRDVGEPCDKGIVIHRGITHEDLANLTGLSRVRVTTILNNLQRARIIMKKRLGLTVTDSEKLQSLLNEFHEQEE